MRRGRDGEPLDDELEAGSTSTPGDPPAHSCRRGFVGEDADGRPTPCTLCRPELVERLRRQRTVARDGAA